MCKSDTNSASSQAKTTKYGSLPAGGDERGLSFELSPDLPEEERKFFSSDDNDLGEAEKSLCGKKWRKSLLAGAAVLGAAALAAASVFGARGGGGGEDAASSAGAAASAGKGGGGTYGAEPLSMASPEDLGLKSVVRDEWSVPGKVWGRRLLGKGGDGRKVPLPTNSWYQNLLTQSAGEGSTEANQVYTVPYILDTVGPIPGLRLHWPIMRAGQTNMQMVYDAVNGLTVGTDDERMGRQYYVDQEVETASPLGVSLQWENKKGDGSMTTHIVRGMPYATMKYAGGLSPALTSGNAVKSAPKLDGTTELTCGKILKGGKYSQDATPADVHSEIQLHFDNSDFTWIVFLSRPAKARCAVAPEMGPGIIAETMFQMRIEEEDDKHDDDEPLFVRVAMLNQCTTGHSDIQGHCRPRAKWEDPEGYLRLLRKGARVFAKNPRLEIEYGGSSEDEDEDEDDDNVARVVFDWDAHSVDGGGAGGGAKGQLRSAAETTGPSDDEGADEDDAAEFLAFALPHHQSALSPVSGGGGASSSDAVTRHCIHTFHGRTCLVKGSKWSLSEDLGPPQSFVATRAPDVDAVPDLAAAVAKDIEMRPSDNLSRGAADTYFSGKVLARIGRVILIASELRELAAGDGNGGEGGSGGGGGGDDGVVASKATTAREDMGNARRTAAAEAARGVDLPSERDIAASVAALKKAVQVWIDGNAEAEYVYDESWGGLVNCGCKYKGKGEHGTCVNKFPDCPVLADVNSDFGNGYYMDHHFHYGYHIYAAAVVAKYDPEWGRKYFDRVLLYVRDIANPSSSDPAFPPFRHKDWYLGSSWASGLISAEIPTPSHGRNQESSSEAIAAYEAIALFGDVMVDAFASGDDSAQGRLKDAKHVRDVGRLLTSMEVRAANRYWHVWNSTSHANTYPPEYKKAAVGMLYETMASFQTWFAPEDFVSYGIQLLPFTPVSERRDDPEWASMLYPAYRKSCFAEEDFCVDNGWTIVLSGLRATVGERKEALKDALAIPAKVFSSDGACGHSLSNTIWYIATRPDVAQQGSEEATKASAVTNAVVDAVDNS